MKSVGPYNFVTHDVARDDGYRVIVAGAYNAGGLIGPEHNGIAVLDDVQRRVVTDRIGCQSSGWYRKEDGPGAGLVALFARLSRAAPAEFAELVNELGSERMRGDPVEDRTALALERMRQGTEGADPNAMLDAISDAVRETADEAGVPEGPERDDWRARKLAEIGLSDPSDPDQVIGALVAMGVPSGTLRPNPETPSAPGA